MPMLNDPAHELLLDEAEFLLVYFGQPLQALLDDVVIGHAGEPERISSPGVGGE